jgi:hypothetical protein
MVWIAKRFQKYANWSADQDIVAQLQMAVAAAGGNYTSVLMALVEDDERTETVFLQVPSRDLAATFVGYEVVAPPLKATATLLVGSPEEFEKHFQFPSVGT